MSFHIWQNLTNKHLAQIDQKIENQTLIFKTSSNDQQRTSLSFLCLSFKYLLQLMYSRGHFRRFSGYGFVYQPLFLWSFHIWYEVTVNCLLQVNRPYFSCIARVKLAKFLVFQNKLL